MVTCKDVSKIIFILICLEGFKLLCNCKINVYYRYILFSIFYNISIFIELGILLKLISFYSCHILNNKMFKIPISSCSTHVKLTRKKSVKTYGTLISETHLCLNCNKFVELFDITSHENYTRDLNLHHELQQRQIIKQLFKGKFILFFVI